jgi:hypothetical protein
MWTLPPLQKAAVMLAGSGCRRLFVMVLLAAGSATGNVESITGGGHEERPAWWPYDPVVYPKMTTYQKRNLYAISLMERVAPVEQRIEGNVSYIVFDEASGAGGELEPLWRTRVMTDRWTEQGGYLFNPKDSIHEYLGLRTSSGKQTSLLSKRVATVRILGGWMRADDGPHQDVVERGAQGELVYKWDRLFARLAPIIDNGLEPLVVLDNVPFAFVPEGERNKTYGQNRAPEDFEEYGRFIADLCRALVDKYGYERVNRWWFRFGTEMDNENHWESGAPDSLEKYLKMYDHGTAGLRSVLPDAPVGPCNFNSPFAGRLERLVPAEKVFRHLATGVNFATGETGSPVDFISISCYGVYWMGRPYEHPAIPRAGYNPSTLRLAAHLMRSWRNIHPRFADLPISVQEHGMLVNKAAENTSEPGAFGGAWTAMQYMIALEEGVAELFHWQDFDIISGPTAEGPARRDVIPTSQLWVKHNMERWLGNSWIPAKVYNASHSDYLQAMAYKANGVTAFLFAGYNPEPSSVHTGTYQLRIPKSLLPAHAGPWELRFSNLTLDNSPHDRMLSDLQGAGLAQTQGVNIINRMAETPGRQFIGRNREFYRDMYAALFDYQEFPGELKARDGYYVIDLEIPVPFTFILEIRPKQ